MLSASHIYSPDALVFEGDAQDVVNVVRDWCRWVMGVMAIGQDT